MFYFTVKTKSFISLSEKQITNSLYLST